MSHRYYLIRTMHLGHVERIHVITFNLKSLQYKLIDLLKASNIPHFLAVGSFDSLHFDRSQKIIQFSPKKRFALRNNVIVFFYTKVIVFYLDLLNNKYNALLTT